MIYRWKGGFPRNGVPVEDALEAVEAIYHEYGEACAEDIVSRAHSKLSKIHSIFEWDDAVAAHQHRLEQARGMVRAIVKVHDDGTETRAFTSISLLTVHPDSEGKNARKSSVYVRIEDALADPVQREEVFSKALTQLRGWQDRWRIYKDLAPLVADVERVVETHKEPAA